MNSPPQSADQFSELKHFRSKLKNAGRLAQEVNRTHLIDDVSKFEAYRNGFFSWDERLNSIRCRSALECILDWTEPLSSLTEENLLELHTIIKDGRSTCHWRQEDGPLLFNRQPTLAPEMVERAIHRFIGWVGSEGFGEIHPIEQAAVSQLRLFEICPFTELSHTVSIIFSYYFLVTAGYLFPTFEEGEVEHYQEAMLDGLQFSTSRIVNLHLKACLRSYEM